MVKLCPETPSRGIAATIAADLPQDNRSVTGWSYEQAFRRNRGLCTENEQQILRKSRVAIAGMGGVGGIHLVTLARLGIGKFTIADPDSFDVANFNRQYGATMSNLGRNKAEVMGKAAVDINPELDLRVTTEAIDEFNVDQFLDGADIFLDGLDFFAIRARRILFRRAAERGIWAITAGPIGCSAAWIVFDPNGMSFDRYFDLNDTMPPLSQLIAFCVGLAPHATHRHYLDFTHVDLHQQHGPSLSAACQLASGVAAAETLKILLHRGTVRPAPRYAQFDAYLQRTKFGHLRFGNSGLGQRMKRAWLKKRFTTEWEHSQNHFTR
jgi:molybdopterin/thiamine biosynthesis adenylyltransferase